MRPRVSHGLQRLQRAAGALLLVAGLAACSSDPIMCPGMVWSSAINVEPVDAETDELLAGVATGRIEHGDYVEEMHRLEAPPPSWDGQQPAPPDVSRFLIGDGNGPGLYDVYVEAPGYESWSLEGVYVAGEECGGKVAADRRHFHPRLERVP